MADQSPSQSDAPWICANCGGEITGGDVHSVVPVVGIPRVYHVDPPCGQNEGGGRHPEGPLPSDHPGFGKALLRRLARRPR